MSYRTAIIVEDLAAQPLEAPSVAASRIYDLPIGLRSPYQDDASGEQHYVVRYPPGTRRRMYRHTAAHTIVVLEGKLNANGRVVGAGSCVHFPGHEPMLHEAAGEYGCFLC